MSKSFSEKIPSPVLDMRQTNNLTIITEEGVEYTAQVYWTDIQIGMMRDSHPYISDRDFITHIPGFTEWTFELTAKSSGPVSRVQR